MTKDDIITLPNPHLRQKSQRIGLITPEIKQIVDDMKAATLDWDASREHEVGVALAAVQIDKLYRIVIVRDDYGDKKNHQFTVFINPEITKREGEVVVYRYPPPVNRRDSAAGTGSVTYTWVDGISQSYALQ